MPQKLAWLAPFLTLIAALSWAAPAPAQGSDPFIVQFVDELGIAIPNLSVGYTSRPDQSPLPRARATSLAQRKTDERGRLSFRPGDHRHGSIRFVLPRGPHVGHLQPSVVVPWNGQSGRATVRLPRPGTLVGKVVGPTPFNDISVRLVLPQSAERHPGLMTDRIGGKFVLQPAPDGTFRCQGVTPGRYIAILNRGTFEARQDVTVGAGEDSALTEFHPDGTGSWVFGVLRDSTGAVLRDVTIDLRRDSKFPYNARRELVPESVKTDLDGRFRFGPVLNGHLYLKVRTQHGPFVITDSMSRDATSLLMVDNADVETNLTLRAARARPRQVVLAIDGFPMAHGWVKIQSTGSRYQVQTSTNGLGAIEVAVPLDELGPFVMTATDNRGTSACQQIFSFGADRIDLSLGSSSVLIVSEESEDPRRSAFGSYTLFQCREDGPAIPVAKVSARHNRDRSAQPVRFVGLPKGRYVCVCGARSNRPRRIDFTVDGKTDVELRLKDLAPCPLEIQLDGRTFPPTTARLARFGVGSKYNADTPPGTYDVLLGGSVILAKGQVTLARGAQQVIELERIESGSIAVELGREFRPLPSAMNYWDEKRASAPTDLFLLHETGFRFEPPFRFVTERLPGGQFTVEGLPPGNYELRSPGRLLLEIELAEGEHKSVKL